MVKCPVNHPNPVFDMTMYCNVHVYIIILQLNHTIIEDVVLIVYFTSSSIYDRIKKLLNNKYYTENEVVMFPSSRV